MIHKISNPYLSIFVSFASHASIDVYRMCVSRVLQILLRRPPLTISDPFRCIAECTKIGSSCNALIFDRWKKTRGTNISMRQMPILREAGQCHLGWASPPCNKSEPTTSVFLARRISEFPCFSEPFFNFLNKITSNDFERKF